MTKASYPQWVLQHKKKGTYVNRVSGRYYLYAAHAERVPGTKKVRRVYDGYLGSITQDGGLVPARGKSVAETVAHEFGLCMTMLAMCDMAHIGLRREFRSAADKILVAGILLAAYGECSQEVYQWSFLSVRFPGLDMGKELTDKQGFGVQRCSRMATEFMRRRFGDGAPAAMARLARVSVVGVGGRFRLCALSEETTAWLDSQKIDWRDWLGEGR